MLLGYARVSRADTQDAAAQLAALGEAGCARLFEDHASGGRTTKGFAGHEVKLGSRWVEAGSLVTLTAYVAHDGVGAGAGGALQSDQLWWGISGPSDQATPTDTAADGNSTWNRTGVGTKQKLVHTYTPTISGYVSPRLVFAPGDGSDVTIHVDPRLGAAA